MVPTRRSLLAGFAAVAAALAAPRSVSAGLPSLCERDLLAGYRWAVAALLQAIDGGSHDAWAPGTAEERPNRRRLATLLAEAEAIDDPSPVEVVLRRELRALWFDPTRPMRVPASGRAVVSTRLDGLDAAVGVGVSAGSATKAGS